MRAKGKRLLVVDDEPTIQRTLRRDLIAEGYEVFVAEDGKQAIEMVQLHQPDLVLLDIYMPGGIDGVEVCVRVREFTQTPIIILSAITEEKQKVKALDSGADDYLTKPFNREELQARVRACLRRARLREHNNKREPDFLASEDGYIHMDLMRRQIRVGLQEIRLTPTEFQLLYQLMLYPGKVLTHRTLLHAVWGPEYGEESDYLRVYIRQLRLKIEDEPSRPKYILTDPGIGYMFCSQYDVRET